MKPKVFYISIIILCFGTFFISGFHWSNINDNYWGENLRANYPILVGVTIVGMASIGELGRIWKGELLEAEIVRRSLRNKFLIFIKLFLLYFPWGLFAFLGIYYPQETQAEKTKFLMVFFPCLSFSYLLYYLLARFRLFIYD